MEIRRVGLDAWEALRVETTAGLFGMWVAPEARRGGIGAVLIDAVEGWARRAGYGSIGLGVTLTNPAAIRFYERMGYVDTGERHPFATAAI